MSNLIEHAKRELELIGAFDKDGDFYGGMTGEAVMELMEVFSKQGHSGMSASVVRSIFDKLANYKNLSPLTFKDDEWINVSEFDNRETYQNRRMSSVFKEGKEGKPYYIEAHIQRNQDGSCWQGSLNIDKNKRLGRCFIKDTANMPTIYIDTLDREVNKENEELDEPGSGWWVHTMKDSSQLEELKKYYDFEIIEEEK